MHGMKRLITLLFCFSVCVSVFCVEILDTTTKPMYFGFGTPLMSILNSRNFEDYVPYMTEDRTSFYVLGINIMYFGDKDLTPLVFNTVGFTFDDYDRLACVHYHTNFDQEYKQILNCYNEYIEYNNLTMNDTKYEENDDEFTLVIECYDEYKTKIIFYLGRNKNDISKGSMNIYLTNCR